MTERNSQRNLNRRDVGRLPDMEQLRTLRSEGGRDLSRGRIVLQYEDPDGNRHELGMSLGDALELMREIETTQRELDVSLPKGGDWRH